MTFAPKQYEADPNEIMLDDWRGNIIPGSCMFPSDIDYPPDLHDIADMFQWKKWAAVEDGIKTIDQMIDFIVEKRREERRHYRTMVRRHIYKGQTVGPSWID